MPLVLGRIGNTALLALAALVIALVVGISVGVASALREGRATDQVASGLLTLGQAAPSFWVGILLILVFGVHLKWLPFIGKTGIDSLVLPACTLAIVPTVTIARVTRSSVLRVEPQDYVRTARSKGLRNGAVIRRHILRNGLIPVVTVAGVLAGELLSGAVITEQIFAWPGIGSLAIQAIQARDYAVLQAVTLLTATIIVVLILLIDFSYFAIDPRIRVGKAAA
jgi:peptide/nickel transport system permease protein